MKCKCSCGMNMRLLSFNPDDGSCMWVCDFCNNVKKTDANGHAEEIITLKRQDDYMED